MKKTLFHNFTPCGAKNHVGPTQAAIDECYKDSSIKVTSINGIQKFVIPISGEYIIEANGAAGYNTSLQYSAGKGASVKGVFKLNRGSTLYVLVGQQGYAPTSNWGGPGGGASYVAMKTSSSKYNFALDNCYIKLLIIAGGGGGSGDTNSEGSPKLGEDATCEELEDGGGINYETDASGGAGFSKNSAGDKTKSFLNGGIACTYTDSSGTNYGSFGGGGCTNNAGGGGGGFKGGDSGVYGARGLGGSSYNSGRSKSCKKGANEGFGYITFYYKPYQCTQYRRSCNYGSVALILLIIAK